MWCNVNKHAHRVWDILYDTIKQFDKTKLCLVVMCGRWQKFLFSIYDANIKWNWKWNIVVCLFQAINYNFIIINTRTHMLCCIIKYVNMFRRRECNWTIWNKTKNKLCFYFNCMMHMSANFNRIDLQQSKE